MLSKMSNDNSYRMLSYLLIDTQINILDVSSFENCSKILSVKLKSLNPFLGSFTINLLISNS